MQRANGFLRYREFGVLRVDQVQSIAVATDLFLIPVAQGRFTEHQRADALGIDLHALNTVTGDRTFDQRVFPQGFELLRRLPGIQFLTSESLPQLCERPDGGHRHAAETFLERSKRHHQTDSFS